MLGLKVRLALSQPDIQETTRNLFPLDYIIVWLIIRIIIVSTYFIYIYYTAAVLMFIYNSNMTFYNNITIYYGLYGPEPEVV